MMISLITALILSQSPVETLQSDAATLGRDLVDGQLCEVMRAGTMQHEYFTTNIESLYTRVEALQLPRSTVDEAAEQSYGAYMAEYEAKYPGEPTDENIATLTAHCQNLIATRPDMLAPYQPD